MVTFLDVLALILIGILTKTGLDYVQGISSTVKLPLFDSVSIQSSDFEKQFAFLFCIAFLFFSLRTFSSIFLNKKTISFLGKQSAIASENLTKKFFLNKYKLLLSKNSQELLYGITVGVDSLVLLYVGSIVMLLAESVFLLMIIVSLILLQPITGLSSIFIFGGFGIIIHKLTSSKAKAKSEQLGKISIEFNQRLLETLTIYRELFLRGSVVEATKKVQGSRKKYIEIRSDLLFLPTFSKFLFEFVLIAGSVIVGAIQLMFSNVNSALASVIVFLGASSRILPSVIRLQGALLTLKQSEGSGQITLKQLDEIGSLGDLENSEQFTTLHQRLPKADLTIKNLNFSYSNDEKFSLRDISFQVSEGQFLAIVGKSGSGKSTLADLIFGLQEPKSGTVLIGGLSPKDFVHNHPGSLAFVPQDIAIIDATIIENVTLNAADNLHLADVENALRRASIWEDVEQMPNGMDTMVGERGLRLSGGQKQRLGIARALYTNPSIILFDEATSALDAKTEKLVTEAIYQQKGSVTLVVIAHRLSTVRNADQVVLLDEGKVLAIGTFEEVRAKVPSFDEQAKLVNL